MARVLSRLIHANAQALVRAVAPVVNSYEGHYAKLLLLLFLPLIAAAQPDHFGFGRTPTASEIAAKNITVMPDGTGLPAGKGTAKNGEALYKDKCAVCHNDHGEGRQGQYPALVGGKGTLNTPKPKKTVGSYWPYATTVWDFINRAMPFDNPRELSPDEVYSVTAYILYLNGIIDKATELNEKTLPKVIMPNRNGFVLDPRPDIKVKR